MRLRLVNGIGTLQDRAKLDALYEESERQPPASKYLFIASGAVFLLGLGLFVSSPEKKEAVEQVAAQPTSHPTASIAQELQSLAELKNAGQITQQEFDLAKQKLLPGALAEEKPSST